MTNSHFEFIDPDRSTEFPEILSKLAMPPEAHRLAQDALDLAESAKLFFVGGYPIETPHFVWGEILLLPWHKEYALWWDGSAAQAGLLLTIRPEVNRAAEALCMFEDAEAPWGLSYSCGFEGDQAILQGLAVEVMLHADRTVSHLMANQPFAAAASLSSAYKNIIECVCKAQLILGMSSSRNARIAADARHSRHREMKAAAFAWLDANRERFVSMDAAATAMAGAVVHVAWRTARSWIAEWHKAKRAP